MVHDTASTTVDRFGYKQEFDRSLRRFASFAIGFSFISITTGIFSTYGSILNSSGPLGIWTWPLVIIGQTAVALVFGALAARMPLAGYSYQWMSRLANPHIGWLVGWFSFAFLVVDVVAVDYALASTVIPALFSLTGPMANRGWGKPLTAPAPGAFSLVSRLGGRRGKTPGVGTGLVGVGASPVL